MKYPCRSNRTSYPTNTPSTACRAASHQELAEAAHEGPARVPEPELVVHIHTLVPVPARSWFIPAGTPEIPTFVLRVTPLEECHACKPGTHRGYGLEWALGMSCECCGDDSLFLLCVAHSLGGKVLCATCLVHQSLTGECQHGNIEAES